ncbi:MAG: hypothetical protein IT388_06660 [Nitrospirales bacterium]|nr:hypothetical protein [Nitrospirales bacterium]
MFVKVHRDIENGVRKVKWFASLLSERVRIEIAIFKLLYRSEELKKRRNELLVQIGEEVYALRGKEKNVYSNKEVSQAIRELEALDPEIKETLDRASEVSRLVS